MIIWNALTKEEWLFYHVCVSDVQSCVSWARATREDDALHRTTSGAERWHTKQAPRLGLFTYLFMYYTHGTNL